MSKNSETYVHRTVCKYEEASEVIYKTDHMDTAFGYISINIYYHLEQIYNPYNQDISHCVTYYATRLKLSRSKVISFHVKTTSRVPFGQSHASLHARGVAIAIPPDLLAMCYKA